MGPIGEGFGQIMVGFIIATAVVISITTYGITKLAEPKEYISSKRLVPELRLTTDGKKVDTVFVYKIKK